MENDDVSAKLWWAMPAALLLVLIGLAMVFGKGPERREHGSSYDASPRGFRAAYLLLEELGYPVVRARRLGGRDVRWVLFPTKSWGEAAALDDWIRNGGSLLLADDSGEFAERLGIALRVQKQDEDPGEEAASGLGVTRLAGGGTRVQWPGQPGEVLVEARGESFVTVYRRGQGEIWLVNRPEFLTNHLLPRAENAVLLCRLASAALRDRRSRLAFDEFFHGMRDRPGVTEVLFQPPTLWVTLHGLALLGLLLWHYVPRFGLPRPPPPPTRRSKEEFLNARASLLERKGDHAAAFAVAALELARELEHELGLPAGTPTEQLAQEATRCRAVDRARLVRILTREGVPPGAGAAAFLEALNELETIREGFFRG
jgi:hypothetical protein